MPRQHTITQGETLAELAAEHGFSRGAQIYEHADNASLREARSNPDVLQLAMLLGSPIRRQARHRSA